ncbi:MAG: uridine kinase [Actinobacteria bacterium]|nr:uridine kinase [Actinomycetota bacterium]
MLRVPARPALVLLAGPSGSGKSRLARLSGCVSVRLDDFYRDFDDADMPRWGEIVDWDDPHSWDGDAALAALRTLLDQGRVRVPVYDISLSRRVGEHDLVLPEPPHGERLCIVAEGIFAPELVRRCRELGVQSTGIWLARGGVLVFLLRLVRDLREHRKAPHILLRRGLALLRKEPAQRRAAEAKGCETLTMRQAAARIGSLRRG